jgi:hypothetical protein
MDIQSIQEWASRLCAAIHLTKKSAVRRGRFVIKLYLLNAIADLALKMVA